MTNNSSPHWDRSRRKGARPEPTGHSAPSEPYAELFAALDRADVSEAVRAAFGHALNQPPVPAGPPDYADVLVDRHLSGRESAPGAHLRPPAGYDPRGRYTLHLTFPAGSLRVARSKAAAYAEALVVLRPELSTSPALLSRADQWNHIEPVTCGAAGPGGETCARATDHLGCHRDSAIGGLCWGDDEQTVSRPDDDGDGGPTDYR